MGAGFKFSLVAASRIAAPGGFLNDSVLQSIFYGVTPIMTLSYTDENGDADIDLACLKTMGSKNGMVEGGASPLRSTELVVVFLTLASSFLSL